MSFIQFLFAFEFFEQQSASFPCEKKTRTHWIFFPISFEWFLLTPIVFWGFLSCFPLPGPFISSININDPSIIINSKAFETSTYVQARLSRTNRHLRNTVHIRHFWHFANSKTCEITCCYITSNYHWLSFKFFY